MSHKHINNEPESPEKRKFFQSAFTIASGFLAIFLTWPMLSFLVGYKEGADEDKFVKVPNFKTVPLNKPTKLTFGYEDNEAFMMRKVFYSIWVIKHSPNEATVFSPMCTHLSCQYAYNDGQQQFACPCHGSVFAMDGKVVGGPAPRPLDALPHKIEGEDLYVQWKVYKPGIAQKVEV